MSATYTFNTELPANAEAPSGGAAAIRLLKDALHERLDKDHYFEKDGDTADSDNCAYHRKATLMKLADDPTAITDMGILYTKDVSGVPELFFKDEAANEIQITSGGAINVSAAFASGDLLLTTRTGAVSGWTDKSATYANKFLRISETAGSTGTASATGTSDSHTLTTAEMPAHTHTITTYEGDSAGGYPRFNNNVIPSASSSTSSTGGGGGHTHGITLTTVVPAYVTVRCYQKD